MSVFCAVASSPVPTIDPCIPRAKRPPPYLEHFLKWINDRIDRMCIELAPWISVRRRHNRSTQRSSHSPCSQQLRHPPWRMLNTCYSWWHDFFFTKWNHSSWRERHRKRNCPMWQRRHRTRVIALSAMNRRFRPCCDSAAVEPSRFRFRLLRHSRRWGGYFMHLQFVVRLRKAPEGISGSSQGFQRHYQPHPRWYGGMEPS